MKKISAYTLLASLLLLAGCYKYENESAANREQVNTLQAKDIFYNRATIQGKHLNQSGDIIEKGFYFSEDMFTPGSGGGTRIVAENIDGEYFRHEVMGLEKGTWYYVQAYVRKSDNNILYGDRFRFITDTSKIENPAIPTGTVTINDAKTIGVTAKTNSFGDENLSETEKKVISVKLAAAGIYFWPSDGQFEQAGRFEYPETDANKITAGGQAEFKVNGLLPDTEYKYCVFVKTGIYRSHTTSYSAEVLGAVGYFTTPPVTMPEVTTGDAQATTTTAVLKGTLDDTGKDPDTKYGFHWGLSALSLDKHVESDDIDRNNVFTGFIRGLSAITTYYVRAYATNDAGTSYGDVESFTTMDIGAPIIQDLPMVYDWRIDNIKPASANIRCKILSDGGQALTSYGVYFGTSPENVTDKRTSSNYNEQTTSFTVNITGLEAGKTYYYKPFAANADGEDTGKVMAVVMPVYGGKQYEFDHSTTTGMPHTRMKTNDTDLYYWELDPIKVETDMVYFLDRNLGASKPFAFSNYNKIPAARSASTWQEVGYYYQFNRSMPSATPDMNITASLSATYGWANADTPPGATWVNTICPEGYSIPNKALYDMIIAEYTDHSLRNFFEIMRLGATATRNPAAGTFINNTSGSYAGLWTNNANNATGNGHHFQVDENTASTGTNYGRYYGLPVRCIRIEPLDSSGNITNPYEPGDRW